MPRPRSRQGRWSPAPGPHVISWPSSAPIRPLLPLAEGQQTINELRPCLGFSRYQSTPSAGRVGEAGCKTSRACQGSTEADPSRIKWGQAAKQPPSRQPLWANRVCLRLCGAHRIADRVEPPGIRPADQGPIRVAAWTSLRSPRTVPSIAAYAGCGIGDALARRIAGEVWNLGV